MCRCELTSCVTLSDGVNGLKHAGKNMSSKSSPVPLLWKKYLTCWNIPTSAFITSRIGQIWSFSSLCVFLMDRMDLPHSDVQINPLKPARNLSVNGSYQCQQSGCQWRRWVGWHCPGPAEMKWSSLMTLVGCSGPAPCCCHSSYRTLCNGDNNTDKVSEYDGMKKNEQTRIQAIVCVCALVGSLQVFSRNRFFSFNTQLPLHDFLSAICITNKSGWKSAFHSNDEHVPSWVVLLPR